MIKKRSIYTVLACAAVATCAFPAFAGLPTIDFGNISGTITMVTQGATGIQQGIETITNGTNLNAIIGDAAGTLSKLKEKYGGDIEKAMKAAQDAQKRLNEGLAAYNKYQGEIAARKAQYEALMETVNKVKGVSYDDSDEIEEDYYMADYDSGYDVDYDAASVSTLQTVDNNRMIARVPENAMQVVGSPAIAVGQEMVARVPAEGGALVARPMIQAPVQNLEMQALSGRVADGMVVEEAAKMTLDADGAVKAVATAVKEPVAVSSITNETTGRKRFGDVRAVEPLKADTAVSAAPAVSLQKVSAAAAASPATLQKADAVAIKTPVSEIKTSAVAVAEKAAVAGKVAAEPVAAAKLTTPSAAESAAKVQPAANKFRVSPATAAPAMKIERMSSSTLSYTSRMAFAAENNTKGVNTDSKGTFISPLPERCGVSIDDLQDSEKMQACLTKVVSENYARNQFDAINSRKDCERMIYNTVVALLAETTQGKYEASNYDETLEKQGEMGGDSNNTRDDTGLLAMTNEQIEILLNRMSLMVSAQIILDSVKQLCAAPQDVLAGNQTESTDGGK